MKLRCQLQHKTEKRTAFARQQQPQRLCKGRVGVETRGASDLQWKPQGFMFNADLYFGFLNAEEGGAGSGGYDCG